jgi:hypothetical protein
VLTPDFPPGHQSLLLHALLFRLLMFNPDLYPLIGNLSQQEQRAILSSFLPRLAELLGTDRLAALARGAAMPIDVDWDILSRR